MRKPVSKGELQAESPSPGGTPPAHAEIAVAASVQPGVLSRKGINLHKRRSMDISSRAANGKTARNIGQRKKVDEGMRQFCQAMRQLDEALSKPVSSEVAALKEADRRLPGETAERRPGDARAQRLQYEMLRNEVLGAVAQITAALAHELNQPLAAASFLVKAAGLRLAREAGDDITAARDDLDEAARQILQVGRIIRGLRDHFADQRDR